MSHIRFINSGNFFRTFYILSKDPLPIQVFNWKSKNGITLIRYVFNDEYYKLHYKYDFLGLIDPSDDFFILYDIEDLNSLERNHSHDVADLNSPEDVFNFDNVINLENLLFNF